VTLSVPAGIGLSLMAGRVVSLLYGPDFAAAAPVVAIIAWDIPPFLLLAFFGNVTAATGLERPAAAIYVASATLNVILNLTFIPLYGMHAAAAVTVASDLLTASLFFVLLRESLRLDASAVLLVARIAVSVLAMAAGIRLAHELPLAITILTGGAVYLAFAVPLRLIDLASLLDIARRTLGRRPKPQERAA
jgi:O-antigen/teichoic acid export membrane protein